MIGTFSTATVEEQFTQLASFEHNGESLLVLLDKTPCRCVIVAARPIEDGTAGARQQTNGVYRDGLLSDDERRAPDNDNGANGRNDRRRGTGRAGRRTGGGNVGRRYATRRRDQGRF